MIQKLQDTTLKKNVILEMAPPYLNATLHQGHLYEQCLAYPYYRFLDSSTREKIFTKTNKELFKNMPNVNVQINIGVDCNGLPLVQMVKKTLEGALTPKTIEKECERVSEINTKNVREIYKKTGLQDLRSVHEYTTHDKSFKTLMEQFLDINLKRKFLKLKKMPHRYCPRCGTFVSKSECTIINQKKPRYNVRFMDSNGHPYFIMTTRPQFLAGISAIVYNPQDERYKHLKGQTLHTFIGGKRIQGRVYESSIVSKTVGTGLMYVTKYASDMDIKVFRTLEDPCIKNDCNSLYEADGSVRKQIQQIYNIETYDDFYNLENFWENIKIDENALENVIHVLRHTERSNCKQEIKFLECPQLVLEYPQEILDEIVSFTKQNVNIEQKSMMSAVLGQISCFKEWCISRDAHYYSFDCPYPQIMDCKMDTWLISALNYMEDVKKGTEIIRIQGTDITDTWLKYTLVVSYILSKYGALKHKNANFKSIFLHRMILNSKNQKISKSKGNGLDIEKLLETVDLRTLRLYFCSKTLEADFSFHFKELQDTKKLLQKFKNLKLKIEAMCTGDILDNPLYEPLQTLLISKFQCHRLKNLKNKFKESTEDILLRWPFCRLINGIKEIVYFLSRTINSYYPLDDKTTICDPLITLHQLECILYGNTTTVSTKVHHESNLYAIYHLIILINQFLNCFE